MDARANTVRGILRSDGQYVVPFFQRHYSWTKGHWERLLDDIVALLNEEDDVQHFLGPLVCTPFKPVPTEVAPYLLIDGQQRLTTLIILLAALRDEARARGLGELADEIQEDYLIHKRRTGLQRLKVVPRLGDREVYIGIIDDSPHTGHARDGIRQALEFFRTQVGKLIQRQPAEQLRRLFQTMTARLSLVVITIEGENPYEIFESLNGDGLPLEESDLIRNYVFMQVPMEQQDAFNQNHWSPFEDQFEAVTGYPKILPTLFYRSFLMRLGTYSKNKGTFVDFKRQNKERGITPQAQVDELTRFARYELWLRRPGACANEKLRKHFQRVQMLEVTTAHPLLLNLLDRHAQAHLSESDLLECIRDLASFVIRRTVCGESTRGYGRWFTEAIRAIHDSPREDLKAYWLERGWPDDRAFVASLQEFALYRREPKKCRLILETLEEMKVHRETVDLTNTTIEHVMPQTISDDENGTAWQQLLGAGWADVHKRRLHTLGNLTLSAYNVELSNQPYGDKQHDFAESHLSLNKYFGTVQTWNEEAICQRGLMLAEGVAGLWPRPGGVPYVPQPEPPNGDDAAAGGNELPKTQRRRLVIKVCWSAAQQPFPDEEISKESAAQTMTFFIKRLADVLGAQVFSRIETFRIGQRRLISLDPSSDFVNQKTGELFGHKLIQGTSYFVFTNLDNEAKVRELHRLVDFLKLPQNFCLIQLVDEADTNQAPLI